MMTSDEKEILRNRLELYEGLVEHMYLDTKGYVTVGIGHLISSVDAAQKLNFIHTEDHQKASANDIKTDYDTVKKQTKGLLSGNYKKYTTLQLGKTDIDALTTMHIDSFEKELNIIYGSTAFASYPAEVRLALFDMIFNLGMTTLKNSFPKFNEKIKAEDWIGAAIESHRAGISEARNNYVKGLFEKAAEAA